MKKYWGCLLVAVGIWSLQAESHGDELQLKNGDRISGRVVRMQDEKLVFETSYAGEITIRWSEIATINTESPIRVVLSDDTTLNGMGRPAEEGKMRLKLGKIVETVSFALADVTSINPGPSVSEPPVKVQGRANVGVSVTKGNTDTETFHADAEVVVRTAKNRYTAGGEFNRAEDEGDRTVDNALGYMKYDHFLTRKWYLYSNALFETDEFKDLKLRTALGVGAGYQFWEAPLMNLYVEAGPAYVNEDFEEAEDEDYVSGRWALNFDRYFFDKIVQFFHFHEGFIGLEDTQNIFIRSRTGLRFPLRSGFNATVEYDLDWDNDPAPGRESVDEMYLFTLGYQWAP